MGLQSYIVKRAAQTIVTIIIVLILMFVLFRLMPGDPVALAIQPGLTPDQRDEQRVALGFARWEVAPGVFKKGGFTAAEPGLYEIEIMVEDVEGNAAVLHAAYVNEKIFPPGSPIILLRSRAEPSLHAITGTTVRFSTQAVPADPGVSLGSLSAWAIVTPPTGTPANVTMTLDENRFGGSYAPNEVGVYDVELNVFNPLRGDLAQAPFGFAANPPVSDITPFVYVDGEDPRGALFTQQSPFTGSRAEVTAIVLSTAGTVTADFEASAERADGAIEEFSMSHPLIAVTIPIWEELWNYLVGMLTGNFGTSFFSGRAVSVEIYERIGPTLLLFGTATLLAILAGIGVGVLLAWFRGSRGEVGAIVGSLFFYSMPIFWFGLILLFIFAARLAWFPLGQFGCIDPGTGESLAGFACFVDILWHMTLPLLTLVIVSLAGYALLMRNSLLEVLGEDFITVARAKGLSERTVMYKHAARNALLPVTTVVAIAMATVISGGVLTETIFSWPGMGFYLVSRTLNQDFPAVQAAFFILALLTILGNVVADIAYAYLDPRVRL
ncbi:MAG: ABC transporter permease [Thermoplasmata archaeon]